jgi:hypothetical protein
MAQWFRLYESLLDDPKVQKLPPKMFKAWVNILALACRHDGEVPSTADIAFALRISEVEATDAFAFLFNSRLLDREEDGTVRPHNWASRQYKSDVSNERVKRYRERHRNAPCNVTETPSESETEADTEQTLAKARESAPAPTPAKRATRLPSNWRPDDAGRSFAADCGLDPDSTADAFTDYWAAAGGRTAAKLDWNAAFRTWCRRDTTGRVGSAPNRSVPPARGGGAYLDQLAIIASRDDADERDRR